MKMLHLTKGNRNGIMVDFGSNTVTDVQYIGTCIDYMYQAPEDCEVRYTKDDGTVITLKAKKGDLVIKFYETKDTKYPVIVVSNIYWKKNVEYAIEQRAKHAEDLKRNCGCCDSCEPCCGC